ncbi:10657_t:CDS:2 [Entrophospora sp. SA101]|nr:10649_t:CDS:2 [Entrophospora sp. SA101]CAJ0648888.1 10657_t:CDS:2 [Entrophospora sp. SA101]
MASLHVFSLTVCRSRTSHEQRAIECFENLIAAENDVFVSFTFLITPVDCSSVDRPDCGTATEGSKLDVIFFNFGNSEIIEKKKMTTMIVVIFPI